MSKNIDKRVPVVLITGYLGSGKTTLMQHILKQERRKVALIVNDMGSINIDASLISKTGNQVVQVEMVELQNGCICCTLRDEFMAEIERLAKDETIEAIFVEASGISEPSSIAGAFMMYAEECPESRVFLKTIVSVVDADRIYREFLHDLESEADMSEKNEINADTQAEEEGKSAEKDGDIINLIMDQIEFCNLLLLNKTDLLNKTQVDEVRTSLRNIQQEADIILTVNGNIDLDYILTQQDFDYEKVLDSGCIQRALNACEPEDEKACVDEYGISSFVFEERRPFNRDAFNKLVDNYPNTLIRSKGYIWFSDDDKHVQLFEQAGRNASITELSEWMAAWTDEEQERVRNDFPDAFEDWDGEYGDRINQIVFIGKGYKKTDIEALVNDCLED
ncbi:MAG: GTP-binding protein [Eubacterium sp.]|nr:GTP-binding protein [Eubacterium sp.]